MATRIRTESPTTPLSTSSIWGFLPWSSHYLCATAGSGGRYSWAALFGAPSTSAVRWVLVETVWHVAEGSNTWHISVVNAHTYCTHFIQVYRIAFGSFLSHIGEDEHHAGSYAIWGDVASAVTCFCFVLIGIFIVSRYSEETQENFAYRKLVLCAISAFFDLLAMVICGRYSYELFSMHFRLLGPDDASQETFRFTPPFLGLTNAPLFLLML